MPTQRPRKPDPTDKISFYLQKEFGFKPREATDILELKRKHSVISYNSVLRRLAYLPGDPNKDSQHVIINNIAQLAQYPYLKNYKLEDAQH